MEEQGPKGGGLRRKGRGGGGTDCRVHQRLMRCGGGARVKRGSSKSEVAMAREKGVRCGGEGQTLRFDKSSRDPSRLPQAHWLDVMLDWLNWLFLFHPSCFFRISGIRSFQNQRKLMGYLQLVVEMSGKRRLRNYEHVRKTT